MKKFFSLFTILLLSLTVIDAEASCLDSNQVALLKKADVINSYNINNNKEDIALKKVKAKSTSSTLISQKKEDNIEVFNQNGSQLKISKADIDLMAKLIYCESRGEPFEGKVAVASVVLNRVMNPKFPDTIEEVIFQKNAFSCVRNGTISGNPDKSCYNAVYEAIRGKDPTNEALFFYNPDIATCTWMKETSKKDSKVIGNHTFFKQ